VFPEVGAHGREVVEGRLGVNEAEVHQARGRVIDEVQERAARGSPLEPVVRAPVELDEFAEGCAPLAQLVDDGRACAPHPPQPLGDHQLPHRLDSEREAMRLQELLARQRRAEVVVALTQERSRRAEEFGPEPVVRGATTAP
jgi:hypothetical protein